MAIRKRTGFPKGTRKAIEPERPDKVRSIIKLRDIEEKSFAEIAKEIGGTRMGIWYLYNSWRTWYYKTYKIL